jgi:hypothetical protein
MAMDRFLIGPLNSGLQKDIRPLFLADDAFAQMDNMYVFRGRVRKRFGGKLMGTGAPSPQMAPFFSRFRLALAGGAAVGITDAGGAATGTVPGSLFKIGQAFTIGTAIYTVYQLGAPVTMLKSDGTVTATFNTTTGAYVFAGAPALTQIYFYPAEPVMGLDNFQSGRVTNQPSFGFDTQFSYTYAGGAWNLANNSPTWHGSNSQFFWVNNWKTIPLNIPVMFVSNFNASIGASPALTDDPIYTYNNPNTTWAPFSTSFNTTTGVRNADGQTYFRPAGGIPKSGPYVMTAKLIVSFKNRLVMLNTIENNGLGAANSYHDAASINTAYPQRCRYSHNGSPFAPNAWYEPNQTDNAGLSSSKADGAGYIDATTDEQIISAEFIKDRLIVYFERSTWELVYTQNQVLPFFWQKINTELGSEATYSTVPFDKVVLTVGTSGINACSGATVERVDKNIPDDVFTIRTANNGIDRVAGIRDYTTEMVYWTFPVSDAPAFSYIFPTRILVYNYTNGSWAFNDDCVTMWGYFEQQDGQTWGSELSSWEDKNIAWNSGTLQANFRDIIAGNQQGFVFIVSVDGNGTGQTRNAPVMQITNIVGSLMTIINHTLNQDDYILIENITAGPTTLNNTIIQVAGLVDNNSFYFSFFSPPSPVYVPATYVGGGSATRVSNLYILTKEYNPYLEQGKNVYISKIDFGVEATDSGQVTINYYTSTNAQGAIVEGLGSDALIGTSILETSPYALSTQEKSATRLWHPVYFQTDGECIQFEIYMSDIQMQDPNIALENFTIDALVLSSKSTSSRLE